MTEAGACWQSAEEAWREAFALAWEAYSAGTVPVGAVIVDGGGAVVSRGRNRIYDAEAPPGGLAGSRLAHAEVNALLGLPLRPEARFRDHVVLTTTEPCLLCAGAIAMVRVGTVRYASADPTAGSVAAMTGGTPYLDRVGTVVEGPLPGPLGAFARLLVEDWAWRRGAGGLVERVCRELAPELAEVVEGALESDVLGRAATANEDVEVAISAAWPWVARADAVLAQSL